MPSGKKPRQAAILDLIKRRRVPHQESLRSLLSELGFQVTQATLSRDIRELRLLKVPNSDGTAHYALPEEWEQVPPLDSILPALFVSAEAVGNLVVVRTLNGSAQAVASGIDWEEFDGLAGTIAGDDTVLLILRSPEAAVVLRDTISTLAGRPPR